MSSNWTTPALKFYKNNFQGTPGGLNMPVASLLSKWDHMFINLDKDEKEFTARALETDAVCIKLIYNAKRLKEWQRFVKESNFCKISESFFSSYYGVVAKQAKTYYNTVVKLADKSK